MKLIGLGIVVLTIVMVFYASELLANMIKRRIDKEKEDLQREVESFIKTKRESTSSQIDSLLDEDKKTSELKQEIKNKLK
jgi:hypothetical protein